MNKRILVCEGDEWLCECMRAHYPHFVFVHNMDDLIYHLLYVDTQWDRIVIGDFFERDFDFHNVSDFPAVSEISKLKDFDSYQEFPIELGKVCRTLSKMANKPEPQIVIMTSYSIEEMVKNATMLFVSKLSKKFYVDFMEVV